MLDYLELPLPLQTVLEHHRDGGGYTGDNGGKMVKITTTNIDSFTGKMFLPVMLQCG